MNRSIRMMKKNWIRLSALFLACMLGVSQNVAQTPHFDPDWQKHLPATDGTPITEGTATSNAATADALSAAITAQSTTPSSTSASSTFSGFMTAPYYPAHLSGDTSRAYTTAMGDFNNDGKMDAAVFSQNGNLTIMLGDGKGGFKQGSTLKTVGSVWKAVVADMNGDGYPDIVILQSAPNYGGTPCVMLNNGDGSFKAPVSAKPGTIFHSLNGIYSGVQDFVLYDVNGDSRPDIVMVSIGTLDTLSYTNLIFETVLNNGDGTFTPTKAIETDTTLANKATIGWGSAVLIRTINGTPYVTFVEQSTIVGGGQYDTKIISMPILSSGVVNSSAAIITDYPLMFSSQPVYFLQLQDINNDGIPDLIINFGSKYIYAAIGKSDGTFGSANAITNGAFGALTSNVTFADINGDSKLDMVIPGAYSLVVYIGNGDGTFNDPTGVVVEGFGTIGFSGLTVPMIGPMVYDFDGDGKLDILYPDSYQRSLVFMKGRGDGTFVAAPGLFVSQGDLKTSALVAYNVLDLNGDGYQDIIAYSGYGLLSGINDGKGNFTYTPVTEIPAMVGVMPVHADFNGDGKEDYLVTGEDSSYYYHPWLMTSKGDGTFSASEIALPYLHGSTFKAAAGDLNGDGTKDLVLSAYNSTLAIYGVYPYFNDGKGNFTAGNFLSTGTTYATGLVNSFALADVNGDGLNDLILSYGSSSGMTLAVYINPGNGNFASVTPINVPGVAYAVPVLVAKDVNGDGKVDLVFGVQSGNYTGIYVALGDGKGNFATPTAITTTFYPYSISVEDYNGDGIKDIAVINAEATMTDAMDNVMGVNIFRGNGDGTFTSPASFNVYPQGNLLLPIDLKGTGVKSLLVYGGQGTTILENFGGSTITLSGSATSLVQASKYTVTAKVAGLVAGSQTPTGSVVFYQDGSAVATVAIDATGSAAYTTSSLSVGSHSFTATYAGDTFYNANTTSNSKSVTITALAPVFTLSSSKSSLTVAKGYGVVTLLTISSNATFSGTVNLSCKNLPINVTCFFAESSVTLTPNSQSSLYLTVNTVTAPTSASNRNQRVFAGGATALALLVMPLLYRRRRVFGLCMLALALALGSSLVTGCGSQKDYNASPGNYSISVVGTPVGSSSSVQVTNLMLTVQ